MLINMCLAREVRLRVRQLVSPGQSHAQRHPTGWPRFVQAGGRELELHRALAHSRVAEPAAVAPTQPLLHVGGELSYAARNRQLFHRVMRLGLAAKCLPHLPRRGLKRAPQGEVLPQRIAFGVGLPP